MTRPTLREAVARLAPGTGLRDGLERILRGRTGALIVLGHDENVEAICDGGFSLDVRYAATRLRELCKMDGAVVLSTDGSRIVRANVQLVPDPSIPTDESGTRHRSAERAAIQTGYPVISVSHSMNIVTVYVRGERHVLTDSATILSRANQAIATLERYKTRLDEVSRQLSRAEIEDFVTLRDVMTVVQRLELVRRIGLVIDYDVVELGTDGRQLRLQLDELLGGNDTARELIVRDYHANPEPPSTGQINATLDELDALSDGDLLDFTALAKVFGYPTTTEAQDSTLSPRGYRAMAGIPRLQFAHADLLVRAFGTLQGLLAASAGDLQSVDGIGAMWARHVREGLSQLAESTISDQELSALRGRLRRRRLRWTRSGYRPGRRRRLIQDERNRQRAQIAQLYHEIVGARPDRRPRQWAARRRSHPGPGHRGRYLLTGGKRLDQRLIRGRAVQVGPQPLVVQRVNVGGQHRGPNVAFTGHQADVGDHHGELRLVADVVLRRVGQTFDGQRRIGAIVPFLEHRRRLHRGGGRGCLGVLALRRGRGGVTFGLPGRLGCLGCRRARMALGGGRLVGADRFGTGAAVDEGDDDGHRDPDYDDRDAQGQPPAPPVDLGR